VRAENCRGIFEAAERLRHQLRECGFCRIHIFDVISRKMFLAKGKASNRVKTMKKFVPHFAVEEQC
jgi:tRNA A58 N-methylase Trm61